MSNRAAPAVQPHESRGSRAHGLTILVAFISVVILSGMSRLAMASDTGSIDTAFEINIPAGSLARALEALGDQSGIQVIYETKLADGVNVRALKGQYTVRAALAQFLANTELRVDSADAKTVVLRRANAASADFVPADLTRVVQANNPAAASKPGGRSAERSNVSSRGESEDDNSSRIQEITVTATKREERAQDVPMSIAVIGNQEIERRGLIGMEDYLHSIPGVNQIDRGSADNAIVIRGITTSPQVENASSGPTVATYFDETSITAATGYGGGGIDVRPVDIERIEVLRGPQGTTFGDASLGGALRIIPAEPKLSGFGAKASASYSDTAGFGGGNSMLQGVVNLPLIEEKLALRAVGYRYDESGVYQNVVGDDAATIATADRFGLGSYVSGYFQDDVGRMLSTGGRLAVLWRPTDRLRVSLNALTQTIEQDGQPTAEAGRYDQKRIPIAPQARIRGEVGEVADTDIQLLSLNARYDLGWAALTSVASWIDSGLDGASSITTSAIGVLGPSSQTRHSDFNSFTAETRLASQFSGRFQFLGGLFYQDVDDKYVNTVDYPGTPATDPFGTIPGGLQVIERQLDQRAIFGEVSYQLTHKLTATAGGRYFKYDKDQRNLTEGGAYRAAPIGLGVPQLLDSSEDGSNFKGNLSYRPTEATLVYASWAQGFRLGRPDVGASPVFCDTNGDGRIDNRPSITIESTRSVDSDSLDSYELGGKLSLFDRRLVVDTAVYHIKWEGLPVRALVPSTLPGAGCGFYANAGSAISEGVELQASLFVVKGLRLDFGVGYIDARLAEDVPAQNWHKDDRLPGSAKVNANLAAQYDFNIAGYSAFVRADSFYTGAFYGDLLRSPLTEAGDYIKVDVRTGIAIRNFSVELFARNVTNEDSFTWRGTSNLVSAFGYRLRPRTIGVQLGYNFD